MINNKNLKGDKNTFLIPYAGFAVSKKNISVCGQKFHQTQMPNIIIASSPDSMELTENNRQ